MIFRNDLAPAKALDLVCDTEEKVDILTQVQPKDVDRVKSLQFAKLVSTEAIRVLAGAFAIPTASIFKTNGVRHAFNLAINRKRIVSEAFLRFATPLAGLTPLSATAALPYRLSPYPHDPEKALKLWHQIAPTKLPLRLATEVKWESVADVLKAQIPA